MDIKTATLGTTYQELIGSERQILLDAAMESFRKQAGYVPGVDDSPLPEPIENRGELIPYPTSQYDTIGLLAEHFHGYGWIAGSAALFTYDAKAADRWFYNDIDVFCVSKEAYQELVDLQKGRRVEKSDERQTVVDGYGIIPNGRRIWIDSNINFVCPTEKDDWSHPANVMAGFDLTICQVAIIQSGAAYVMNPFDIESQVVNYTGESIAPVATMRRIFKYLHRGYQEHNMLWYRLANDNRMLPVLGLFESLAQFEKDRQMEITKRIFWAVPTDSEIEYSYGSDDDD